MPVFALAETEAADERPGQADAKDTAEAHEVVEEASKLDRVPIGTDWER
jgi:hypothetical protein